MKLLLFAMLLLCCATARGAEPPLPPVASTNSLVILSEAGARFSKTNAVWRGQVRAADPGMYIECELLTASFSTNTARTNVTRVVKDEPPRIEEADADSRLDFIIAETNVMIITPKAQIVGDRAIYNASNELMIVTGDLVIAVNARGSIVCQRIIFDPKTESFEVDGPNTFVPAPGVLSSTNALFSPRKTNAPPKVRQPGAVPQSK